MHPLVTILVIVVVAILCLCLVALIGSKSRRSRAKAPEIKGQARIVSQSVTPPPAIDVPAGQPAIVVTRDVQVPGQSRAASKAVTPLPAVRTSPLESVSNATTRAEIAKCKHGIPEGKYCINCVLEKPLWNEEHLYKYGDPTVD